MAIAQQQEGASYEKLQYQEQEKTEIFQIINNVNFRIDGSQYQQGKYVVLPQLGFSNEMVSKWYKLITEERMTSFIVTEENMLVWNMQYTIKSTDPSSIFYLHPMKFLVLFQYSEILLTQRKTKCNIQLPLLVPMAYEFLEVQCRDGELNIPLPQKRFEIPIAESMIAHVQQLTFQIESLEPYYMKITNSNQNIVNRHMGKGNEAIETIIKQYMKNELKEEGRYELKREHEKIKRCFPCKIPYAVMQDGKQIGTIVLPTHHKTSLYYRALHYSIIWIQRGKLALRKGELPLAELAIKKEDLSYAATVKDVSLSQRIQAMRAFEEQETILYHVVLPIDMSEMEALCFVEEPYYAFTKGGNIICRLESPLYHDLPIELTFLYEEERILDHTNYTCEMYSFQVQQTDIPITAYKRKQQVLLKVDNTVYYIPFFIFYYEKILIEDKLDNTVNTLYFSLDTLKSALKECLLEFGKEALKKVLVESYQKEYERLHNKKKSDLKIGAGIPQYGANMYTLLEKGEIVFEE